jgi:hypothetical protein
MRPSFHPQMGTTVARSLRKAPIVETERPSLRNEGPDRRSHTGRPDEILPVRLTRKYADAINGISLAGHDVGDRLPLPPRDAQLLIAEGWADPDARRRSDLIRNAAADRRRPR